MSLIFNTSHTCGPVSSSLIFIHVAAAVPQKNPTEVDFDRLRSLPQSPRSKKTTDGSSGFSQWDRTSVLWLPQKTLLHAATPGLHHHWAYFNWSSCWKLTVRLWACGVNWRVPWQRPVLASPLRDGREVLCKAYRDYSAPYDTAANANLTWAWHLLRPLQSWTIWTRRQSQRWARTLIFARCSANPGFALVRYFPNIFIFANWLAL